MQKNLVIVESPAKAKNIEKFLGSDYKVMSSFGHIRDLKKKNFGVDLETFQPEYEIPEEKQRVVAELRSLAKKADTVWLASDDDREGEAISWHLAEVLKLDPQTARRIVFHEVTKPALLAAIEHPRTIDLNKVDAQQARRILDRLVGFKLSPVLWRKVRPSLSAGRVQSVAVRLIVEREREIEAFKIESSYRVVAQFLVVAPDGSVTTMRATLNESFATEADAEAFLLECQDAQFTISNIQTTPLKRYPAPPFTTATLQQEAARKLGFPVTLTMRVAQSLYENGLITYMRTDSTNLSAHCLNSVKPVIEEMAGPEYHQRRNYHTNEKGAQEAHEAIRPTDMKRSSIKGTLQEQHLYELIWKRTVACQMADAELEKTVVNISISGKSEEFVAMGEVVTFDGFLRVYRESDDDVEESEEGRLLPPMNEGQVLAFDEISAIQRFSKPPVRYTEATLIQKFKDLGIGRPSTYAPIIQTIQQREYVRRGENEGVKRPYEVITLKGQKLKHTSRSENFGGDRGRIVPTDTGIIVTDFLMENFPTIMDYNFTANVEQDFDDIAAGEKNWVELVRSFYGDFSPVIDEVLAERSEHKVGERQLGIDPASGKPVSVKIGRFGPMVQIGYTEDETEKPRFAKLAKNQSMNTITLEEALDLFRLPRVLGEFEGEEVRVGVGKFGPYVSHQKKYTSLDKTDDPLCISLERAIELISAKREQDQKSHLRVYTEEPELEVRSGRYGPYIAYQGTNYRLPKNLAERAAELTYEEVKKVIETEAARPKRKK